MIHKKTVEQIDRHILNELKKFKKERNFAGLTNVGLNKHITKILQPYIKPHEPLRTSFEYQLFLSVARNTTTHVGYIK